MANEENSQGSENTDILDSQITKLVMGTLDVESQKDSKKAVKKESSQVSDDLEDLPNGKIRLEKMKKQRDEAKIELDALKYEKARLEGELSVLKKPAGSEESEDPTTFMTETEKKIFNELNETKSEVARLKAEAENRSKNESINDLSKSEEAFFNNNPELQKKRDEVVEEISDFLKDNKDLAKQVIAKKLSINQVWAMINADKAENQATTTRKVQNPDVLASGGRRDSTAVKSEVREDEDAYSTAVKIAQDRDSRNKAEAAKILNSVITRDIISIFS